MVHARSVPALCLLGTVLAQPGIAQPGISQTGVNRLRLRLSQLNAWPHIFDQGTAYTTMSAIANEIPAPPPSGPPPAIRHLGAPSRGAITAGEISVGANRPMAIEPAHPATA